MKHGTIIKKIVFVSAASVAVSVLYLGVAQANIDERTIYIEDVHETIEIGAGYYDKPIYIKSTLATPSEFKANTYTYGNNTYIDGARTTAETSLKFSDYMVGGVYTMDLGVNEQMSLAAGYYGRMNIRNSVKNNGTVSHSLESGGQVVNLESGYYEGANIEISDTYGVMLDALNSTLGTNYSLDTKFSDIATSIQTDFTYNPKGTSLYTHGLSSTNQRLTEKNGDLSDINLAGNTLSLGVDEALTIPRGYYSADIIIENGDSNKDDGSAVLDGDNQQQFLSEGYYSNSTVTLSPTYSDLTTAINTVLGTSYTGNESFETVAQGITGSQFTRNPTGTASYSQKINGYNDRLGTSDIISTLTGIALAGQSLNLGVNEKVTIPAGYYDSEISIQNGVTDRGDATTVLNGNNKLKSLPAGYYDDGAITLSPTYVDLVSAINSTFGTSFTGNEAFSTVAQGITGEEFENNPTGTAYYNKKITGSNERIGTNETEDSVPGIELSGEVLNLGIDESLIIPAGYYDKNITIQNGVVNWQSGTEVLNADNKVKTLPAGYYEDSTVSLSPKYLDLIAAINNVFATSFTGNEDFADVAAGITGALFKNNPKATAYYTEKTTGTNDRIGTSNTQSSVSDVTVSGEVISLGINEAIVISPGYYNNEITIQNGVVDRGNIDTAVSAAGPLVTTGSAGYYSDITVRDSTPSGSITVYRNSQTKTWDNTTGTFN